MIRLASFDKDGLVSREGMVTTIEPRMPDDAIDRVKIYKDHVEQTAMLRLASTWGNILAFGVTIASDVSVWMQTCGTTFAYPGPPPDLNLEVWLTNTPKKQFNVVEPLSVVCSHPHAPDDQTNYAPSLCVVRKTVNLSLSDPLTNCFPGLGSSVGRAPGTYTGSLGSMFNPQSGHNYLGSNVQLL